MGGRIPDFRRNWAVVALRGSLDEATVDAVEREIRLLRGHGARLIVEVSELHFLDGFGVDVLVLLAHRMHQGGGVMAVVDGRGYVRQVLGDAGLDGLLPLFPSMAAAVAGLGGPTAE
ncbi:STAS domain-containing protein (plasmid) [Actinomadura sp. ATCC 31491]|uniref:STAS domain-containing protein n=1 Tax=Actinomadura luzonensis TaxID=2805427 RepID=A0ABT0GBU6_9ACTN|nr:STAS domain-containing protein [Actinomadura luzonensis]MCK2222036.1 STAS domain-containing protein [Actinomadura luzonensis]